MHDTLCIQNLLNEVERQALQKGAGKVLRLTVVVGRESGFTTGHFQEDLDFFKQGSLAKDAVVEVEEGPGKEIVLRRLELEIL